MTKAVLEAVPSSALAVPASLHEFHELDSAREQE
jgi:hypothetical protein